jgi:hypothetical protein
VGERNESKDSARTIQENDATNAFRIYGSLPVALMPLACLVLCGKKGRCWKGNDAAGMESQRIHNSAQVGEDLNKIEIPRPLAQDHRPDRLKRVLLGNEKLQPQATVPWGHADLR